ncbi:monovalent cation/H+ antiporter complex subunit F [Paramaledivibacter caminithermalis]|jgi:multicomponent Na+:H+ antiporter subunit F|uniref:Multicomponent Na+:H+ antiporter subunit F n=1 Tax=Paramaledivibacter caminithermalis (strain DSM 15212 / CIP 107654 / DViRD3) TaxID=1121301 RepID=A0A1M6MHT7_PARC5|nr:monovalent cation/H+ antiporter complex subunit F [Paramaledivibacter caminithermalis]SHJ82870.1 multicomponent Na+:H+ antiporter subunit F [Paramaledivibacter caminithermalis DSM 15212]
MLLQITMVLLAAAMFASLVRMIIGPTIWERLLALNLISAKTLLLLVVHGVYKQKIILLDIAFTYGIIGFLTITLLARLILAGGREK